MSERDYFIIIKYTFSGKISKKKHSKNLTLARRISDLIDQYN